VSTAKPLSETHPASNGMRRIPRPRRRSLFRRGIEAIALFSIAAILSHTFLVDGWLVPSVVSSGSMAPALLGPHREARCEACGMPLVCDAEDLTVDSLVCPNCGWPGNPLEPRTINGKRLFIDRATLGIRPPGRWEVFVFRCSPHAQDYCVKRIIGLPGESVEIREGDVYIDGRIARKTLVEQQASAMLVHDSAYRDPRLPPRWKAERTNSDWATSADGGWHRPAGDAKSSATDWLTYVHSRRMPGSLDALEETPIRDDDPYNPDISRRLNDVTDVMLEARLRLAGNGELYLRAMDGRATFQLRIQSASGRATLERNGQEVQTAQIDARLIDRPVEIVLSTFDRRLLFAIDGRRQLIFDDDRSSAPPKPVSRPFAIAANRLAIAIERLRVLRDVYYTPPTDTRQALSRQLGPDEYFVLGDNSPISVDSRSWMGGQTVPSGSLVGRVLNARRRQPGAAGKRTGN
jgi:signal peptidase I